MTSIAARETGPAIDALAELLGDCGDFTDPRIHAALHAATRHLFAPARGWYAPDGPGRRHAIDARSDPDGWWNAAYGYGSIVTQAGDGAADPAAGTAEATSSLSSPGAVAAFLQLLDVQPGDRVLEIGTGSGWTAALLCALGAEVTTMEVDPGLAASAQQRLHRHRFDVTVRAGDGAQGVPGAVWDAVHVTCGVTTVPSAWVVQTRPGGRIVLPWMPEYGEGHKAVLTVTDPGRAAGRLAGTANFMMLRSQRTGFGHRRQTEAVLESVTPLGPRQLVDDGPGADVAVAGLLPDVMGTSRGGTDLELLFEDTGGTSWARCRRAGPSEHQVLQSGPRRLWDEVADAHQRWVAWGRPERERFGITVAPDEQFVWLDHPASTLAG